MSFWNVSHSASVALLILGLPANAATSDLWTAARGGDAGTVRDLVRAGSKVDAVDQAGQTALMKAAQAASFGALRELLRLGADPAILSPDGKSALAYVDEAREEALPCQLILRAYAFNKTNGRTPAGRPSRPNLVLLFEPTVNYLHPALKKSYYVNEAELKGKPGVDDDGNGFVDDIYGWNLDADQPHAINPIQYQIYLQGKDDIVRLFKAYNDRKLLRISAEEYSTIRRGYDNPLAKIFGRNPGFANGDFLDQAISLSHGSHVAGIVLDHSSQEALIHTLSWQSFGDAAQYSRSRSPDELARAARNGSEFLRLYRADILVESLAAGRRLSDYVRQTGAGVVNMSMGANLEGFAKQAQGLAYYYISKGKGPLLSGGLASPDAEELQQMLPKLAFECYIANSVKFLIPMAENPDVLFVISSGNDGADNDKGFQSPAYLSRFMPNSITVGAVDDHNEEASFSNTGLRSVDIMAPGVQIRSTAIPEASVLMDGTSMAAPAVAGAAAFLRAKRPQTTAAELKKLIVYTAEQFGALAQSVSSGGVLDQRRLSGLAGSNRQQAMVFTGAALRATRCDPKGFPERFSDAELFSERATALDPDNWELWADRALILHRKGDTAAALGPSDRAIQLADKDSSISASDRALCYHNRGLFHLVLGHTDQARSDAKAAMALGPKFKMDEDLQALGK